MKLGLGANDFLYADDAKVLANLVEIRRIWDPGETALELGWDFYDQTEMFMRSVALRQGSSEMELIFEIVFSRTLIGFRRLYPIGLASLAFSPREQGVQRGRPVM